MLTGHRTIFLLFEPVSSFPRLWHHTSLYLFTHSLLSSQLMTLLSLLQSHKSNFLNHAAIYIIFKGKTKQKKKLFKTTLLISKQMLKLTRTFISKNLMVNICSYLKLSVAFDTPDHILLFGISLFTFQDIISSWLGLITH